MPFRRARNLIADGAASADTPGQEPAGEGLVAQCRVSRITACDFHLGAGAAQRRTERIEFRADLLRLIHQDIDDQCVAPGSAVRRGADAECRNGTSAL